MKRLYVGNMSFKTTESDFRELFKPFVPIKRMHVAVAADS
jgi:RNA recognition motif-containing protein